jgi:voltage-gated potassium channel
MNFSRLSTATGFFLLSVIIGIAGYVFLEDYSAVDAFYMTVITIGTVGFTEVKELSPGGRLFTAVYIIFNLAIYAYTITVITRYLFEGELSNTFSNIRTKNKIKKMKDHVIVCGYGRNGSKAVEELVKNRIEVVVVEKGSGNEKLKGERENGITFVYGDATRDETLEAAGISTCRAIISTLPSDADNVYIVLTARGLNPEVNIVARASEPHSENKLKRAGADHIVMPEFIGGLHMASLITNKLSLVKEGESANLDQYIKLDQFPVTVISEEINNREIGDVLKTGFEGRIFVGYKTEKGDFIFNPEKTMKVEEGGILFFVRSGE